MKNSTRLLAGIFVISALIGSGLSFGCPPPYETGWSSLPGDPIRSDAYVTSTQDDDWLGPPGGQLWGTPGFTWRFCNQAVFPNCVFMCVRQTFWVDKDDRYYDGLYQWQEYDWAWGPHGLFWTFSHSGPVEDGPWIGPYDEDWTWVTAGANPPAPGTFLSGTAALRLADYPHFASDPRTAAYAGLNTVNAEIYDSWLTLDIKNMSKLNGENYDPSCWGAASHALDGTYSRSSIPTDNMPPVYIYNADTGLVEMPFTVPLKRGDRLILKGFMIDHIVTVVDGGSVWEYNGMSGLDFGFSNINAYLDTTYINDAGDVRKKV